MIASLQNYYADGLLLQALAARLCSPIIVFSWNPSANIWQRSVLSPTLTGGFAQPPKKGMQPVVIALRDQHYQAFCPDCKDVVFPSAWLAETDPKDRTFFRGGGSASTGDVLYLPESPPSPSHPDGDRLLLPDSPVSARLSLAPSGRLSLTDSPCTGTSGVALSIPASGQTFQVAAADVLSLPASSVGPNLSLKAQRFGDSFSVLPTIAPSSIGIKRRLLKKQTVALAAPRDPPPSSGPLLVWKCPVCGFENFNKFGAKSAAKIRHYQQAHPEIPQHIYAPGKVTPVPEATDLIPADQRAWSCAICNKGLPTLPPSERMRAIKKHIQDHRPEETPRSLDIKRRIGSKASPTFRESISRYVLRQKQYPSHRLIMVVARRPQYDRRNFWCRDCFSIFKATTGTAKFDQPCKMRQQEMASNGWVLARKRYWWQKQP